MTCTVKKPVNWLTHTPTEHLLKATGTALGSGTPDIHKKVIPPKKCFQFKINSRPCNYSQEGPVKCLSLYWSSAEQLNELPG